MSKANGWQAAENASDLDVTNPPSDFTAITATMDAHLIDEIARLKVELRKQKGMTLDAQALVRDLRAQYDQYAKGYHEWRQELERLKAENAALGKAVREMQQGQCLLRAWPYGKWISYPPGEETCMGEIMAYHDTPEEALRKAKEVTA
jgi:uncharacterized small protein (DUF1192 family)